ncbi:hypothetical protein [[Mycobacterium] appelbergii]|uniref:hypothetical protein n=1 Tax=[Mycobacterium] appelbergii TaxID=2939269 RepID=UPI0029392B84|nr:hypothetical protein [Mycobacterium sp. 21AC1]
MNATPAPSQPFAFSYLPLWPFGSQEEADRWSHGGAEQGHSPWHADAAATALFFSQNYLGFAEIDRTTGVTEEDGEAWVGVGHLLPNGKPRTAATIHLARFGADPGAPWEVVGTRDDVLTLEEPAYGATVGPTIATGGTITGVDESLQLRVHQLGHEGALAEHCCTAAGGQARPWSVPITMTTPPQPGALTLVVWTGGHVADVELFAVTGLRAA